MFKYTRASRPTTYKQTEFRSELEASWAAFFDIRGIIWEYEPLLNLSTWRPDFLLETKEDQKQLTEVKPYLTLQDWEQDTLTIHKIINAFQNKNKVFAILLGASPLAECCFSFGLSGIEKNIPMFEPIFINDEDVSLDWNRAKNTVRWRP